MTTTHSSPIPRRLLAGIGRWIKLPWASARTVVGAGEGRAGEQPLSNRPKSARYQSLDLWRGAACMMLVFYHATFYGDYVFRLSDRASWTWYGFPLYAVRHFWIGVPIFFVISGYCIAASVNSLRKRPHSIRDYFVRRFRRIYPPLWIMCAIAVVFSILMSRVALVETNCDQLPNISQLSLSEWFGNFFAAESWRHHISGGKPTYLMPNTWTLCYEEQFYAVVGLMLAISARRFFGITAVVTACVIVFRYTVRQFGITHHGFFWDGHWVLFATGILVFYALNYCEGRKRIAAVGMMLLGMVGGALERTLAGDPFQKHLGEYLFVACGFAIALLFLRRWDEAIASLRVMKPLRWCGQRSYSIYLTHYLIVVVVSSVLAAGGLRSELLVATIVVPVCVIASLPFGVLFYHTVERRFLNQPVERAKSS